MPNPIEIDPELLRSLLHTAITDESARAKYEHGIAKRSQTYLRIDHRIRAANAEQAATFYTWLLEGVQALFDAEREAERQLEAEQQAEESRRARIEIARLLGELEI